VWFRQHGAQQMKQIQRHHLNLVVWVGLWGLCGLSHALGLGPVNSRVTMGEGLSLTVPVRLERGEHLSDECVSADVYFGDDKVSAFKVDVSLLQGSQGPYAIQVLSTLAVNEPVVTVQVAAGCLSHVARRYVVMADPLGLPMVSASVEALGAERMGLASGPVRATDKERVRTKHRAGSAGGLSGAASSALSMRWSAPASTEGASLKPASASALAPAPVPMAASRLMLSGMRMDSTMNVPTEAADDSAEVKAQRASALAHWWALQATPGQLALEQARLQDLERRVAELKDWRPPTAASAASQAASKEASPSASDAVSEVMSEALADGAAVVATADAASADSARHRAPPVLPVDPDEVRYIRIVGLLCVGLVGLAAWGYQLWRRQAERRLDLEVEPQGPAFAAPPPSWLKGG
jgi:pilus assembly protein FimV